MYYSSFSLQMENVDTTFFFIVPPPHRISNPTRDSHCFLQICEVWDLFPLLVYRYRSPSQAMICLHRRGGQVVRKRDSEGLVELAALVMDSSYAPLCL